MIHRAVSPGEEAPHAHHLLPQRGIAPYCTAFAAIPGSERCARSDGYPHVLCRPRKDAVELGQALWRQETERGIAAPNLARETRARGAAGGRRAWPGDSQTDAGAGGPGPGRARARASGPPTRVLSKPREGLSTSVREGLCPTASEAASDAASTRRPVRAALNAASGCVDAADPAAKPSRSAHTYHLNRC